MKLGLCFPRLGAVPNVPAVPDVTSPSSLPAHPGWSPEWGETATKGRSHLCSFAALLAGDSRPAAWLWRQVQAKDLCWVQYCGIMVLGAELLQVFQGELLGHTTVPLTFVCRKDLDIPPKTSLSWLDVIAGQS